jgi:ribonucleotide reductase alpha subunit
MMNESKLQKIRALLAKAESTTFPEEAEALSAKAMELMALYSIDDAMLAAAGKSHDDITHKTIQVKNPYSKHKVNLLYVIAISYSCKSIAHPDRTGRSYSRCTLVGFASDVERVEMLYTSLLVQATGQLLKARPSHWSTSVAGFRSAWFMGFVNTIYDRLEEIRQRVTEAADTATPGTVLVLVDRAAQVKKLYDQMFTNVSKINSSQYVDTEGYRGGEDAGRRADLGQDRVETSRRSLSN